MAMVGIKQSRRGDVLGGFFVNGDPEAVSLLRRDADAQRIGVASSNQALRIGLRRDRD